MGTEQAYEEVFRRAAQRALATAARSHLEIATARGALESDDWASQLCDRTPEMQAAILREAIAKAWGGRFGNAKAHLADLIRVRRLAARTYARSRDAATREAWFDAAARTGNAYRIAGMHGDCERVLRRLGMIEDFIGATEVCASSVRSIQERSARRVGFLARLEWARGNYAAALHLSNWEVAKRRLLADPDALARAYVERCIVRLDWALDFSGREQGALLAAAQRDVRLCQTQTSNIAVLAPAIASLVLWLARTGDNFEPYCEYLESWVRRGHALPEAIALRLPWARGLREATASVGNADATLAHCYEHFCALGRTTDAGIVVLDRIRIRYEAGLPLGIVQVVLEAKARLDRAGLTPETNRVLDALWVRVLQTAQSGLRRGTVEAQLEAAHVALARE